MFQLEIFRLAQLAKPSRARKNWSGAPRWLQMRRDYAVYKACALTMRCSRRPPRRTRLSLNTLGGRNPHVGNMHNEVAEVPMQNRLPHPWLVTLAIVFATSACSATSQISITEAERIRETERQRLRSLVEVDMPTAERLHADDFQLINPAGSPLTKREYLDSLRSRQLDYVAWEPGEIAVRLYGRAAVIRYATQS